MNKFGYIRHGENYALTYQIGETPLRPASDGQYTTSAETSSAPLTPRKVGRFYIWPNGADNLDPNTCKTLIMGNRLLPQLIEKQIAILYGTGPKLFKESISPDGKIVRTYVQIPAIQAWLDSWLQNGLPDSYEIYLNKCIRSYYYSEGIFSKIHLSRAQITGIRKALPVAGLEHVSDIRCRMATTKDITSRQDVEDRDFTHVMVGNWEATGETTQYKTYPRMDYTQPLARHCAIAYAKNPNQGEEIYATNKFFRGIKEWIRGCNATPEYINSFLENSLSARHHVIIPQAWMDQKEAMLQELCDANRRLLAEGKKESEFHVIKIGKTTLEVGINYTPTLLDKYVKAELDNLTAFLSGRGKNQGKVYASRSFRNDNGDLESWEIKEIPQKYKEYIEAIISYDKRADMVLLSAKGIDSSISNVSSDGVISKSGADSYYNYIIYLTQQAIPESIVCSEINHAIRLNFPQEWAQGIRLGFYRPNVQHQDEVSPADRLSNQSEL